MSTGFITKGLDPRFGVPAESTSTLFERDRYVEVTPITYLSIEEGLALLKPYGLASFSQSSYIAEGLWWAKLELRTTFAAQVEIKPNSEGERYEGLQYAIHDLCVSLGEFMSALGHPHSMPTNRYNSEV